MTSHSFLYSNSFTAWGMPYNVVCWRCAYLCVCLCIFHVFWGFFFTLREEFGEISWHLIQLTYRAVLCSLLCVLGNMAALCCPARPWRQLPVHFRRSEVCVCRRVCLCLFSLYADFSSLSNMKHLHPECLLWKLIHFCLDGCLAVWVTTTWWWITTRNNAA